MQYVQKQQSHYAYVSTLQLLFLPNLSSLTNNWIEPLHQDKGICIEYSDIEYEAEFYVESETENQKWIHARTLTWFTVHLRPPAGILFRPTSSIIADSKSGIPWPVTAQVKTCLSKELESELTHSQEDEVQSILLTTRTSGEVDEDALWICKKITKHD